MDDKELHRLATQYQEQNNVGYTEAVSKVIAAEKLKSSQAKPNLPQDPNCDSALDAAAKLHAQQHNVSYSEAISAVCSISQHVPNTQPAGHQSSDHALDDAARRYARSNNVSYSEALSAVCTLSTNFGAGTGEFCSFSEASDASVNPVVTQLESQPIEIFRAGQHVSDDGQTISFSVEDVRKIAAAYNPRLREAPLTVGHPADSKPAYGWVGSLSSTPDGRLLMSVNNVEPQFAQAIKDRRFSKRSASFYPPMNPNNPAPGTWYLRHVAWLGAQQPAVSGLQDVVMK